MNVQFARVMPLFSAKHAGVAAALVYALAVTDAHVRGFNEWGNKRQLSDDVVLAQYAGDDDENFSDFDEEFDRKMDAEFADDIDEDSGDDFVEEYADDYGDEDDEDIVDDDGDEYDNNQQSAQSVQERLDRNLDRQIQVIEKTILWRNPMGPGYF